MKHWHWSLLNNIFIVEGLVQIISEIQVSMSFLGHTMTLDGVVLTKMDYDTDSVVSPKNYL